jgi:hypothetical protein
VTFTAGIVSSTHASLVQSASIERTSEVARIKDTGGTIKTLVFSGGMKTLRISVVPSGTTTADGQKSADAHVPAAGTTITVADASSAVSGSDTVMDASYNCLSATQNRTVDGVVTIDLVLEASDEGQTITNTVAAS